MTAVTMGPAVGALVRDIVHDHLPGRLTRCVVIAMSRDVNAKVTVMVFVDGAPAPLLALKVGITHGARRSVDAEAAALGALAAVDPTMVHHTVPRVLELRSSTGHRTADECPPRCSDVNRLPPLEAQQSPRAGVR